MTDEPEAVTAYFQSLPARLREIAVAIELCVLDDDASKLDMICVADVLTAARELEKAENSNA